MLLVAIAIVTICLQMLLLFAVCERFEDYPAYRMDANAFVDRNVSIPSIPTYPPSLPPESVPPPGTAYIDPNAIRSVADSYVSVEDF